MAYFVGIEIFTETAAGSGARVASFGPEALATCVLKQSLTAVEQLAFTLSRQHAAIAELVHGRIARIVYSDTTLDTEWRISDLQDQSGASDHGQLQVTAQALSLDLARAPYVAYDSAGRPTFDFSATQLTATQWLAYVVTACAAAPLPYTVSVGTVDFTNAFDLSGDFATALEIIRAIQQPGRAPGDFVFRRNSATDYKLDLLASRGSTATTVRVQTARNLLDNVRKRTLINLGTKIVPRGTQGNATRDLSQTYWKVASVDSGTTATLSDPYGGAGPSAFADQLKNLYVARLVSTFSSQIISASTTGSQITVASTAGWVAGNFVRFFTTSGSTGSRVVSLSHPTRVLSPASGGYGPVVRILDIPTSAGDANLVTSNAWMSTWTTSGNAPDGWTRTKTYGTWSRESTIIKIGAYSNKLDTGTTAGNTVTAQVYTPTLTPYTTSGLRFCASIWVYFTSVSSALQRWVRIRVMKPDLTVSYADGAYLDPTTIVGSGWVKLSVQNVDLSGATAGCVVMAETYVNNDPNGYAYFVGYTGPATLSESDTPIDDVLYNGGIAMWQRSNVLLATISTPVAGYTVQLADLGRLDTGEWADEPLTLGGSIEVVDADLSDTTTQRVVDLEQNLLNPLAATVQLQTADPLLTNAISGVAPGSTISGSSGQVMVTPSAEKKTTAADFGIADVYTKTQIDALLAAFAPLGGTRTVSGVSAGGQGGGAPLTVGGITFTSGGTYQLNTAGGVAFNLYQTNNLTTAIEVLDIFGYDPSGGGNEFYDVVVVSRFAAASVFVISTATVRGAPNARAYGIGTYVTQSIAGATQYRVVVGARRATLA